MWNEKKPETKTTEAPRPMEPAAERATGWLGASLRVKGEISGTEDLLIDGPVEGSIHLNDRKLTVGKKAKITADIEAGDVVVYGYVKGNVRAKGRVEIKKDGYVVGNLTTAQIMIEDGADFKGTIEIDRSAKEAEKNVPARAAAAAAGAGASATPTGASVTPKSI
ncbi:MAG TPA: polymer-forming cytoskeletal protein [Candidatus Acidoferrum sp.]|nr:polymer-forming cytoskeletal protein [Candidatus Acidoferrum sp.]